MHIGMFTDVYKPSINGVTRSVDVFREALQSRGHRVTIIAPQAAGSVDEKNVVRVPSITFLSPKDFPIGFPISPTTHRAIESLNFDIIHTHHPFFIGSFGQRIARRQKLPVVHTYHTHLTEYAHYSPVPGSKQLVKHWLRRVSRDFSNASDQVIAPSSATKVLLQSYGVTKPIVVNQTGIKIENFPRLDQPEKEQVYREYSISPTKKIVMYGGRLAEEKNLPFLIEVFTRVAEKRKDIHFVFAGGGPMEHRLESLLHSSTINEYVTVTGFLSQSAIARLYGIAQVFAFASQTETQGIVLTEAMAAGAPVLAIGAMGVKDVVSDGEGGYVVAPDAKEFTEKIELLLNDTALWQRQSRLAQRSAERFSIDKTTDRLLSIYEGLVRKSS